MSSALVEAAWEAAIWEHDDILAITDKILNYEHTEDSGTEIDALIFEGEINFFEWVVTRGIGSAEIGSVSDFKQNFIVEIRYTKAKDPEGEAYSEVRDAIETLTNLVFSELGPTWSNSIDYYNHQEGAPAIGEGVVAGVPVWRGVYKFTGVASATLS